MLFNLISLCFLILTTFICLHFLLISGVTTVFSFLTGLQIGAFPVSFKTKEAANKRYAEFVHLCKAFPWSSLCVTVFLIEQLRSSLGLQ